MYNALNNLTDLGYISKEKMRDQGRFLKFQYKLTYEPTISWKSVNGKSGSGTEEPFPEKPDPVNQDLNNKRFYNKEKRKKKNPPNPQRIHK